MQLFDTHSHLQDPAFEDVPAVLGRARAAGVGGIVICGYDAPSNEAAVSLAASSEMLSPTVGFHPHEARDVTAANLAEMESLAALPEVVGVGEIGLDFFRDHSPRDAQRRVLDAQLAIAVRVGKPVSVHSRGAEEAIFEPLAAYSEARGWLPGAPAVGVMHCFGGSLEQAKRYIAMGFLVSIPCSITYPRNHEARRIAAQLPLESLVTETDSPYLPPQAFRGRRNEPAHVVYAVSAVAEARGISFEQAAEATTQAARRLFAIRTVTGVATS